MKLTKPVVEKIEAMEAQAREILGQISEFREVEEWDDFVDLGNTLDEMIMNLGELQVSLDDLIMEEEEAETLEDDEEED